MRGGTWRSEHGETSEALFLTSGYTYDSAEEVAARFAGEAQGMGAVLSDIGALTGLGPGALLPSNYTG